LLPNEGIVDSVQDDLLNSLAVDYRQAILAQNDRAMLDYAIKLTREPWAVTGDDIGRLREAGFDDRAIHDICAVTAYYAFVNRIADGLGVELEGEIDESSA
jgi:uncharacterized peroxidase-related enzyme